MNAPSYPWIFTKKCPWTQKSTREHLPKNGVHGHFRCSREKKKNTEDVTGNFFKKKKKSSFFRLFFFSKNGNPCFQLLNSILIFKVYEKVFPLFPDTFFIWLTHEIFFSNWKKKKNGGRLKKKSVGSYSETETVYFLLLKLLGATLGRLFFTFKCLNLRKIAFYSMFIKKNTLFFKNHSFSHKFDWPRKSRNNCTSFSHKTSFFKTKKKLYGQKRQIY